MARKITIKAGQIEAEAELNDTRTADAIWETLPIEGQANLWGDEIYFAIPVKMRLEKGQEVVQIGDLGYWPPGAAFCIFFGETPVSRKGEIRPASAVTVFGKVTSDSTLFKKVLSGTRVLIGRTDE
ncbi:MAG: hypothetical protein HYX81_00050 [Chloroflexi bacterium]|nr:hypothetical protein [Chloroflexota bacterium]